MNSSFWRLHFIKKLNFRILCLHYVKNVNAIFWRQLSLKYHFENSVKYITFIRIHIWQHISREYHCQSIWSNDNRQFDTSVKISFCLWMAQLSVCRMILQSLSCVFRDHMFFVQFSLGNQLPEIKEQEDSRHRQLKRIMTAQFA